MKEIRWHGRGGNGAFTAARLLGIAASVYGSEYAQAFPSFGPERRGAPVLGFTRIDDKVITDHSQVYSCDLVIVLDETLCEVIDVSDGIKENGTLIINSTKDSNEVRRINNVDKSIKIITIDATQIALDILGVPIVNTIMLGAAIASTDIVKIDYAEMAIDDLMSGSMSKKNKKAMRYAYNIIGGKNE